MKKIITFISIMLIFAFISGFFTLFNNRSSNNNYDNVNNSQQEVSLFSNLSMLCIGDSITYGYSYVGNVDTRLQTRWCDTVGTTLGLKNVYNYGVNGSSLCNGENSKQPMCDRVKDINVNADIITLLGGTNDFRLCFELGTIDSTNTNTIYGALNSIANTLKNKYPNSLIIFMTPLPFYVHNSNVNDIGISQNDIAGAIVNVAKKYNFDYIDLHNYNDGFDYMNSWYTANDYMHPSQEYSTTKLAPLIANYIKVNYPLYKNTYSTLNYNCYNLLSDNFAFTDNHYFATYKNDYVSHDSFVSFEMTCKNNGKLFVDGIDYSFEQFQLIIYDGVNYQKYTLVDGNIPNIRLPINVKQNDKIYINIWSLDNTFDSVNIYITK